jgi:hypothetical protein
MLCQRFRVLLKIAVSPRDHRMGRDGRRGMEDLRQDIDLQVDLGAQPGYLADIVVCIHMLPSLDTKTITQEKA